MSTRKGIARYCENIYKTLAILRYHRNSIVIVQNPSAVLAGLAALVRPLLGYTLVVDAHNAGIHHPSPHVQRINRFVIRAADHVVVTNNALATFVTSEGGSPLILPDPLPQFAQTGKADLATSNTARVLFICTWATDEPYFEVFKAAKLMPQVQFLVTGFSKDREKQFGESLPGNILLTGYLPDEDYENLLHEVKIIIDLTTRQDCLVCGAYEAVAAETPLITSNSQALQNYFCRGTLFTDNSAESIALSIKKMLEQYAEMKSEISEFKQQLEANWCEQLNVVKHQLGC
ncbi:MAG: glycosyltransferase [Moraxellaceae bacterium]|nr:MAG: glycosyltransferase [Moraxellaceae bacterium]